MFRSMIAEPVRTIRRVFVMHGSELRVGVFVFVELQLGASGVEDAPQRRSYGYYAGMYGMWFPWLR